MSSGMTDARQAASPLVTAQQRAAETLSLRLVEHPSVRSARETARLRLLADPVAQRPDGRLGLDRALDQWVLALAMRVANNDPFRPAAVWNVYNPARTWFGHTYPGAAVAIDNPDNVNREIPIDGASSYAIRGRYGARPGQFTIEIVADFDASHAGLGRTLSALTSQQIKADADGSFTITVDTAEAGARPNHLRSEPGRLWVFARDSLPDWTQTPVALTVERLDGPDAPPARGEDALVEAIVAAMPGWVGFWCGFKDDFLGYPEPNRLVGPLGRPGGWGFLAGGRFAIAGDEAVVVTTIDGQANYTGFQVSDPWTISPDPVFRLASLNRTQARADEDGTYTYVLSSRDPGVHNWIDSCGLSEGWMMLRWQGVPPGADPKTLIKTVRLVRLAELAGALPRNTPTVDLAGRSRQIASRIATHGLRTAEA
jgi:hypothetical protein